ncbi:MAG: transposase [Bryobacteraceae bacterium]|nr:transposase [Bryobacteraceae bacterium]
MVRDAIISVCQHRHWRLIALHVRADHVHGLVQAVGSTPARVAGDWKAYSTRALQPNWPNRQQFWTQGAFHRSVRGAGLAEIARYILDGQGDRLEVFDEGSPPG